MKKKTLLAAALAAIMCLSLTGCGKEDEFDPNSMTEDEFESRLKDVASKEDAKNSKNSSKSKSDSNLEEIDPFEGYNLVFEGTAPSGTARDTGRNPNVAYSLSKNSGLKNGDKVVVTAELYPSYASKYALAETEKEFTVEGLVSYAMKLDEIPEDMKQKMLKQGEDSIRAYCATWLEGNSLSKLEPAGYYFLSQKEGGYRSTVNSVYCVFKVTANVTGYKKDGDHKTQETVSEVFYTYYKFDNIKILPDGTCSLNLSDGKRCRESIRSDYGSLSYGSVNCYYYEGYRELDSMFNDCVTKNLEGYNYETTVTP